jgi:hypothetical protein
MGKAGRFLGHSSIALCLTAIVLTIATWKQESSGKQMPTSPTQPLDSAPVAGELPLPR